MRPGSRHAIHRPLAMLLGVVIGLFMLAPLAFAAEEMAHTGRVLISTEGDVTLPAGEQADSSSSRKGPRMSPGDANTVIIIDGAADLTGATVETIVVIRGDVAVDGSSMVTGDVMTLDATTSVDPAAAHRWSGPRSRPRHRRDRLRPRASPGAAVRRLRTGRDRGGAAPGRPGRTTGP